MQTFQANMTADNLLGTQLPTGVRGTRSRVRATSRPLRSRERSVPTGFLGGKSPPQVTLKVKTKRISKKLMLDADAPAVSLPPRFLMELKYSSRALKARAKVVNLVLDSLAAAQKMDGDTVMPNPVLELVIQRNDAADLCGALIVLLELKGEDEQIISVGSAYLSSNKSINGFKGSTVYRDIAMSVAIAHRNLAARWNRSRPEKELEEAMGHASNALSIMQTLDAKYGVLLREELYEVLLSLATPYTTSLLSKQASRKKGLQVVKDVLLLLANASGHRAELLLQIGRELTAMEQMSLLDALADASSLQSLTDQELYELAIANLAEGYASRWPQHVYRADTLFEELNNRSGKTLDVTLERAVCALMLGKAEEATRKLVAEADVPGLHNSGPPKSEPASKSHQGSDEGSGAEGSYGSAQLGAADSAFVVLESADESEVGKGKEGSRFALEAWAESWIELSVLSSFKDMKKLQPAPANKDGVRDGKLLPNGRHVSLKSYLSSPKVVLFNQLLYQSSQGQLQQVGTNIAQTGQGVMDQFFRMTGQQKEKGKEQHEQEKHGQDKEGQHNKAQTSSHEGELAASSGDPAICNTSLSNTSSSSSSSNGTSSSSILNATSPTEERSRQTASGSSESAGSGSFEDDSSGTLSSIDNFRSYDASMQLWVEDSSGKIKPRTLARVVDATGTDRGITLERAAWMNAVKEVVLNSARVTAAVGIFAVAFLYTRPALQAAVQVRLPLPSFGSSTTRVALPNSIEAAADVVACAQRAAAAAMDPAAADQILVAYLSVRATVMRSPALAEKLLPKLLVGPALEAARQQAQDLLRTGRHLDLTHSSVEMRTLEVVHGKDARVTASVRESGSMHGSEGAQGSSRYTSKRDLDVVLRFDPKALLWKVSEVADAGVI